MNSIKSKEKNNNPNFYNTLPKYIFNHDEFTKLFNKRMTILRDIKLKNSCYDNLTDEEDVLSHFITRLIMANNTRSTKWFISRETSLLKYRLGKRYTDYNFTMSLPSCSHPLKIDPLCYSSKDREISFSDRYLYENSKECRYNDEVSYKKIKFDDYLSVHFSRISLLLSTRSIIPIEGYVYLDKASRDLLIANQYKNNLEIEMHKLSNLLIKYPDGRLEKMRISSFYEDTENVTSLSNLNDDAQYFPPCIKKILHLLKINRHIKNTDRQTLCLFLKDANVSINETIDIFRNGFNIDNSEFDKKYLYHIRHAYGLEGKRANYSSYNCIKMANSRNSENRSLCPCVDDRAFIKSVSNLDIEDIFREKGNVSRCLRILNKEGSTFSTPIQYYIASKEKDKNNLILEMFNKC